MKLRNTILILAAAAFAPAAFAQTPPAPAPAAPAPAAAPADPAKPKKPKKPFVPLFNGKDLTGWVNMGTKEGAWHVADGILTVDKAGGGWLRTDREYRDFTLRLDFRLSPGGNSGVFLRAPLEGDGAYAGLEIQVLDHFDAKYKDIQPGQFTGSIYQVVPAADPKALKPAGEWNHYEITHMGDHVKVVLNGVIEADANLSEYVAAKGKEHPGLTRKQGYIGLQSHDAKVEYKGIEIREVKRRPAGGAGKHNKNKNPGPVAPEGAK